MEQTETFSVLQMNEVEVVFTSLPKLDRPFLYFDEAPSSLKLTPMPFFLVIWPIERNILPVSGISFTSPICRVVPFSHICGFSLPSVPIFPACLLQLSCSLAASLLKWFISPEWIIDCSNSLLGSLVSLAHLNWNFTFLTISFSSYYAMPHLKTQPVFWTLLSIFS